MTAPDRCPPNPLRAENTGGRAPSRRGFAAAAAAALLLGACAGGGSEAPPPPVDAGIAAELWLTTTDKTQLLARQADLRLQTRSSSTPVIDIDAAQRFQTMAGFGASITDASAYLLTHRVTASQREALLRELFGRGAGGLGFDLTRLTIGASDFSRTHYSLDDRPAGQTDPTLAHFTIEPNRAELLPVVKQALAVNPQLHIMASPWSAPGWMKTNDSLIKGALKPEHNDAFARYLVRYVEAYAAEGIPVFALTLQNEPHFEPGDYPGMRLEPAQRATLFARHIGPLLKQRGLKTQLIEWDHNWDNPQSPLDVLADPAARAYVHGVGWHCYAGEVSVQSKVHDAHPDKDTWLTECSGGEWKPRWQETLPWMMRNLVIGATRHWARGVLMWNLALDERYGPHLGGCNDCRGIVTIDSKTGAITRNMEYYAFGHASRFVRIGAQRIASTGAVDGIDHVAFRNADDGSLVVVLCNSAAQARRFALRQGGRLTEIELPRESVATVVWRP